MEATVMDRVNGVRFYFLHLWTLFRAKAMLPDQCDAIDPEWKLKLPVEFQDLVLISKIPSTNVI